MNTKAWRLGIGSAAAMVVLGGAFVAAARANDLQADPRATKREAAERQATPRVRPPEPVDAVVQMLPQSARLRAGEQITLSVVISSTEDVGHAPFHVIFDPRVLRFESGEQGDFLGSTGNDTAFFASPTSSADRVVVGLAQLGRGEGVTGDGELCRLHFTAMGRGHAALGFERASVRDGDNHVLRSRFLPAVVSVR